MWYFLMSFHAIQSSLQCWTHSYSWLTRVYVSVNAFRALFPVNVTERLCLTTVSSPFIDRGMSTISEMCFAKQLSDSLYRPSWILLCMGSANLLLVCGHYQKQSISRLRRISMVPNRVQLLLVYSHSVRSIYRTCVLFLHVISWYSHVCVSILIVWCCSSFGRTPRYESVYSSFQLGRGVFMENWVFCRSESVVHVHWFYLLKMKDFTVVS